MENTTNVKSGLLGFLAGATVGVLLGVLYAPKSGEETRKLISDKTNKTLKKSQETLESEQKKIEEKLVEAKDTLMKLQEQVQKKGDDLEKQLVSTKSKKTTRKTSTKKK